MAPNVLRPPERVLFFGSRQAVRQLLEDSDGCRFEPVGVITADANPGDRIAGCPVVGGPADLVDLAQRLQAGRIVVALGERRGTPLRELTECWCRGLAIEPAEAFVERVSRRFAIDRGSPGTLLFSGSFRPSRRHAVASRALGVAIAAACLALLLPLLGLVALAIKADSPGPVLFRQRRVGLRGRPFRLIKFRTMQPGPDDDSPWVRDNLHRVTRVGKWLRRFRLDELPQFWNVLAGQMNLVGPRPHPLGNGEVVARVASHAATCGMSVPYYELRMLVRPGITGWSQVRYGYANDLDQEVEKLAYDLYYVKHMTLWLDLQILWETFGVVFLGNQRRPDGRSVLDAVRTQEP
jgi:lipopolysaccharide/colanic/teichoic acid biosynthesis glycosyltransferase